MKKLLRILAAVLVLTLVAGMGTFALAENNSAFKFKVRQDTLVGAQTVNEKFTLAHKAATMTVTVKITSNITGEETDVDIYRLKYEVLNPAGKRIGKQVALDALEGKNTSTQTFSGVDAGDVKVKIVTNSAAANLIYTVSVSGEYEVSLNKTKIALVKGKTATLKSDYAGGLTKTWTSSDPKVATVSSSGVVTAIGPGKATVTLKAGSSQAVSCAVTVYGMSASSVSIYAKSKYQMSVIGQSTGDTVTWASSNTSIATVNSKGKVTGVKAGKCTITATVNSAINGKTYTLKTALKVKKNVFPKTMKVIGGSLALRASASTKAALIRYYPAGTKVTVSSITDGWAKVTAPDGKKGYMMASYLSDK